MSDDTINHLSGQPASNYETLSENDPLRFAKLVAELDQYNTGNNSFAFMAADIRSEPLESVVHTQGALTVMLVARNEQFLETTGLTVEQAADPHGVFMGQGSKYRSRQLRTGIQNAGRLLDYLADQAPLISSSPATLEALDRIANMFSMQVLEHYDLNDPSETALQLVGNATKIHATLQDIGVAGEGMDTFATYLEHIGTRSLREYLEVIQKGILNQPGGYFGPASWHRDSTPDEYRKYWQSAIAIVRRLQVNPLAQTFFAEVRNHLLRCSDFAAKDRIGPYLYPILVQARSEVQAIGEPAPDNR